MAATRSSRPPSLQTTEFLDTSLNLQVFNRLFRRIISFSPPASMSVTPMIAADSLLLFQDWGVPILLRSIISTYIPHSGMTSETVSDISLIAVVGWRENKPLPNSATLLRDTEQTFLIREVDLPTEVDLASVRVVHEEIAYRIQSTSHAALSGLLLLQTSAN